MKIEKYSTLAIFLNSFPITTSFFTLNVNLALTLLPAKSSPTFKVATSLFQLKITLPVSLPFSIVTPISPLLFTKVLINSVKSSVIVVL